MRKTRKKIGLPPGSVIFTGNQKVERVQIHALQYNIEQVEDNRLDNHSDIVFYQPKSTITNWYDIRGIHDTQLIQSIGNTFQLHALILEDIVDPQQRSKFEEYENGIFIIIKALSFNSTENRIVKEQVALFFRKGLVLTFQEDHTDLFEAVRRRIHSGKGKVRQRGSDYLAYALVDAVVDNYYVVLDSLEEKIERLEDRLLDNPDSTIKAQIHHLKKEIILVRKSVAPLREAINRFSKSDNDLIEETTFVFVRSVYDHTIQIMDAIDNYRDMLNGLQDLYISEISFKMNQVMQVLTIITTIFVPLSFLVGLYGMNFDNMPELHFKYGYFVLLGVMAALVVGLLYWFKKRNWI